MKEKLFEIIAMNLGIGVDQIKLESEFIDDLGADSLDTVELIMEFEESFNIDIPDHEAEQMYSVGSVYNYIRANYNDPDV